MKKLTNKILLGLGLLFCCSIIFSAFKFRQEYDKNITKGDLYFLYSPIQEQPFSHLMIRGGNVTTIVYEPAERSSVRVFNKWAGYNEKRVKTTVSHDTLYLDFPNRYKDNDEKNQLGNTPAVRIFSPVLKSITCFNTNLLLSKFKQKELTADISGNSSLTVESLIYEFTSVSVKAADTTDIIFEMSSSLRKAASAPSKSNPQEIPAIAAGWDIFHIQRFHAEASGQSFINIGRAQVDSIDFKLTDTASILLSGGTIRKNKLRKS